MQQPRKPPINVIIPLGEEAYGPQLEIDFVNEKYIVIDRTDQYEVDQFRSVHVSLILAQVPVRRRDGAQSYVFLSLEAFARLLDHLPKVYFHSFEYDPSLSPFIRVLEHARFRFGE